MSESQGGAGRREVAWRLFASEFDDSDFSYSQSDEERAPNYVVTPTGARVNRLFVVGVLTEIETVSEDYLRARVVDPTGPFVIYAGQYQPDALAFLERADPPTFVAVTGKARTYQPDDSDQVFTSIRPESISEVEGETRDRWVVQTAEQTVDRVARMAAAKQTGLVGDELQTALEAHGVEEGLAAGIPLALEHYGTTGDYLAAVREMALDSARVVADEIDEAETLGVMPGQGGDDVIADLVERPIDLDSIETTDEEPVEDEIAETESEEAVAEAGAGNGSAIGTAESSSQTEAESESEQVETTATSESTGGSTAESADEPAVESAGEPADEPADTAPETGDTSTGGAEVTTEPAEPSADGDDSSPETTTASADATANPDSPSTGDDDLEDFEPEFDLDEDEREELEEEFGTEFQSGSEVSEPGEAGIETPDPEAAEGEMDEEVETAETAGDAEDEVADDADEAAAGTAEASAAEPSTEIGTVEETEPAPDAATGDEEEQDEAEAAESEPEPAEDVDFEDTAEQSSASPPSSSTREDVDLEDAVMDAMTDLDEGDGAERDDVLAAVVDRTGADTGDVEDAIQDALMGGRCYEPDDATLKPI